jgi:hypothetical protein
MRRGAMAFYMVQFDGSMFINEDLCQKVYSGGERSFIKKIARGEIVGRALLDQVLYPVTDAERDEISDRYGPQFQDFDEQYRRLNVLSKEDLDSAEDLYPGMRVVQAFLERPEAVVPYRQVRFLLFKDFSVARGCRYGIRPNMALVRLCKYWYVALGAVNITAEKPIIVTAL